MIGSKINLKDMTLSDIEDFCLNLGEKRYRGEQIFRWLYKGISSISEMSNIPETFRIALDEKAYIGMVSIEKKYQSKIDGTVKYLLKLEDGNIIESVLMEYSYGLTACISTQVGCGMGCSFCASTIGGMIRDLSPGEMVDEILSMMRDSNRRISNIVLMGSGEPLANFDNVIKFLEIINSKAGLNVGMRHIAISTCGLVPQIKKLAKLDLQITLAISLHAPNDEIRKRLMPIAQKYTIKEVLDACREYIKITNKRITFEYSLIKGVNDSIENAYELSRILKGMLCHVNLIPINEIREREYKKTDSKGVKEFKAILESKGIEVTIRRELGSDINAACGQLRKNYINYMVRV
ncbi:MAG TPA: 23S rRNA (adenine(2503)-C(2))-methyltransferase RlmN [Clostridiaceae bacterium]|nr:23S rRNA (adenine(2503)-C(2))-methyltransferase RlmN [Clostridiaceae bacterium]